MGQKIITRSVVDMGVRRPEVSIDPWGLNPLYDDAVQVVSGRIPKTPPPRMFTGGAEDLPAFTASGLDPRLLLRLPYRCRHGAAAVSDPAELHGIFEIYASDPHAGFDHEGFDAAVQRVRDWLLGNGKYAVA